MAFEDVSEEVEQEARRVAAAFEVEEWGRAKQSIGGAQRLLGFEGAVGSFNVSWVINHKDYTYDLVDIRESQQFSRSTMLVLGADEKWIIMTDGTVTDELMVRGLYRLGFEDEGVLSQLPQLSAHEKLELRLSMPREFWPKQWLEEENASK